MADVPDPAPALPLVQTQFPTTPGGDRVSDPDPIVAFLTARLDDDARIAQGAAEDAGDTTWTDDSDGRLYSGAAVIAEMRDGTAAQDISFYIASHDPRRVLADVAAKRAILGLVANPEDLRRDQYGDWHMPGGGYSEAWIEAVCHLARVYSDHPDFDPSWAS